jgi:hypothetical protein
VVALFPAGAGAGHRRSNKRSTTLHRTLVLVLDMDQSNLLFSTGLLQGGDLAYHNPVVCWHLPQHLFQFDTLLPQKRTLGR